MANKTQTIRIESILGGHSTFTNFSRDDQYLASIGIDPSAAISASVNDYGVDGPVFGFVPSGLIRPVGVEGIGTTVARPMWLTSSPKNAELLYVYDQNGSIYSTADGLTSVTSVGDLNDGGTASGNGAAYYDNYIYFARDTTVARYGPLNGTPVFTDDYWASTLGLTALSDTTYPDSFDFAVEYPNHVLHRHSDGRLYIADVVDNKGTIHYIKTTKTTVEGDTNDGSVFNALQVGYGLHPMCMESYGNLLVIAFTELDPTWSGAAFKSERAKVAFWDTTSDKANSITWPEYPDSIITAIKNVNGVLYFVSAGDGKTGFRIMRYVGGNSFAHVAFIPYGDPSPAGAVDGDSTRLIFGTYSAFPRQSGSVYSNGLPGITDSGIFNILPVSGYNADNTISDRFVTVTAVKLCGVSDQYGFNESQIVAGYTGGTIGTHGLVKSDVSSDIDNSVANSIWWSRIYTIGQPFRITKIRIPLAEPLDNSGKSVIPSVYIDSSSFTDIRTLTTINQTNYGNDTKSIVIRPQDLKGDNAFFLELKFSGTQRTVVSLPITIEYEVLDVDTVFQ